MKTFWLKHKHTFSSSKYAGLHIDTRAAEIHPPWPEIGLVSTLSAPSAFACKLSNKYRLHTIKHCETQAYRFLLFPPTLPCLCCNLSLVRSYLQGGNDSQRLVGARTPSLCHEKLHRRCKFDVIFFLPLSSGRCLPATCCTSNLSPVLSSSSKRDV